MLSKGKQITLGIFTVIAFSVAATLALGEFDLFDIIKFADTKPILLRTCYVLYFAVFIIYAALAKRKNLEPLAKTTIVFGSLPAVLSAYMLVMSNLTFESSFLTRLDAAFGDLAMIFLYPILLLAYPFAYININDMVTSIFGTVALIAAPIVAGILYLITTRAGGKGEPKIKAADESSEK